MRILFCSVGLVGHFNPLVPFIEAAQARGDEVMVVVPPKLKEVLEGMGVSYRISDEPDSDAAESIWDRAAEAPKSEAVGLIDGEFFGRLCTEAMLPMVEETCDQFGPEVILREPCAYAGVVAARQRTIAHAQVAISTAEAEWGLAELVAPILSEYGDDIESALRAAPYLTRFPASLDPSPYPRTIRYREAVAARPQTIDGPWVTGRRPLLYVTFGSIADGLALGAAAFRIAIEAVTGLGLTVLVTTGRDFDLTALDPLPTDVFVERWVPQSEVFARASAVVCHGGSGTSYGALAAGLPTVFVPMFADQHTNARLISDAGAATVVGEVPSSGFRVLGPSDVARIRAAVTDVLTKDSYREAAQRLAVEIGAATSVDECLAELAGPDWRRDSPIG